MQQQGDRLRSSGHVKNPRNVGKRLLNVGLCCHSANNIHKIFILCLLQSMPAVGPSFHRLSRWALQLATRSVSCFPGLASTVGAPGLGGPTPAVPGGSPFGMGSMQGPRGSGQPSAAGMQVPRPQRPVGAAAARPLPAGPIKICVASKVNRRQQSTQQSTVRHGDTEKTCPTPHCRSHLCCHKI